MDKKHKDILRRNRMKLLEDMNLESGLVDFLLEKGLINEHIREKIFIPGNISFKRNGEFIDTVQKRGPRAFGILYDGLIYTEQFHLADLLKPEMAPSDPASKSSVGQTASVTMPVLEHQLSNPVSASDDIDNRINVDNIEEGAWPSDESFQVKVKPISWPFVPRTDARDYRMTSVPRGRAIIINNERFKGKLSQRTGTNVDSYNINMLFQGLHFKTVVHRNQTADQIKAILRSEAADEFHENADCFVLVVLSHGEQDVIYGTDEQTVSFKELYEQFDGNNCPQLKNKPKLFFIQACQGGRTEDACNRQINFPEELQQVSSRMEMMNIGQGGDQSDAATFSETSLSKADIIFSCATFPEYISWRNEDYGSWFIRAICEVFQDWACEDDLIELLRKVRVLVGKRKHVKGHRQTTTDKLSTLTKRLYFNPRETS